MKYILVLIVSFLLLTRCIGIPNFSNTPEISYKGITKIVKGKQDSLNISVNYQDGDGDLGIDNGEINTGRFVGEYANNFIVLGYRKVKGQFQSFKSNSGLSSSFQRLNPQGKKTPLKGTLYFGILLVRPDPNTDYKAGDTLKFDVYIYDRELNKSNTVTTGEVVLSK